MKYIITMILFLASCNNNTEKDKDTLAKSSLSKGIEFYKCIIDKNNSITNKIADKNYIDNNNFNNDIDTLKQNCIWGEIKEIEKYFVCMTNQCKKSNNFYNHDLLSMMSSWKRSCPLNIAKNCDNTLNSMIKKLMNH